MNSKICPLQLAGSSLCLATVLISVILMKNIPDMLKKMAKQSLQSLPVYLMVAEVMSRCFPWKLNLMSTFRELKGVTNSSQRDRSVIGILTDSHSQKDFKV